jgi:hypothetical protein
MKLIIAGSRDLNPCQTFIHELIVGLFRIGHEQNVTNHTQVEIVCGLAKGVDLAGRDYALEYFDTPMSIKQFPADWETHGKAAGPIRNGQMAEYADVLLLIWDGESKGSANMKENMLKLKKPIYEVILKKHNT